jgi:hypothetical protein
MPPIQVDVVTPLPESWGLCVTCEAFLHQAGVDQPPDQRSLEAFPPDWQQDFLRLSDLVQSISEQFGERVRMRLYDPRSLQGLAKAIRYGVRRYPTFIVEGRVKIAGLAREPLVETIRAFACPAEVV